MKNRNISEMIADYKKGDTTVLEKIWNQMLPLIKKYSYKTHFLEYDDAFQEYSAILIEAINKIQTYDTNGQCLKYIVTCFKNKFYALYKNYCNGVANEIFNDIVVENTCIPDVYNDIIFLVDIAYLIKKLPSENARHIATLSFLQQKTDTEIALYLGLSRQYVNRIKKELYQQLIL